MRLIYASGTAAQPPWVIDSVEVGITSGGRGECSRIVLRMRPDQSEPTTRVYCRGGDTLFAWNATEQTWRPDRPIGAHRQLTITQRTGTVSQFTTGDAGDTTIAGYRLPFIHTTIVTLGPDGRVTRRLRERYSLPLATALGGTFEVPDSTRASGWRETQRFELVDIQPPRNQ